jgi:hypothetical protein
MDRQWWDRYIKDVSAKFQGDLFTINTAPKGYKLTVIRDLFVHNNSGIGAIALAIAGGAKRVVLLGYDCQLTDGKAHWHDDHVKGLGNANGINKWPQAFAEFAKTVDIEVINATRQTALTCFKRMDLESVINA